MTSWHSYPSIFALGHRAVRDILTKPVTVEEKIDGSQFSFGVFEISETKDADGRVVGEQTEPTPVLKCRSKSAQLNIDAPEKMFATAVEYVKSVRHLLVPGWTYRGEYLAKPKHNTLVYDRIPQNNIIIFDINPAEEDYLPHGDKVIYAARIGLETVPLLFEGNLNEVQQVRDMLDRVSCLGGQKIEGVVVKNYELFGDDKKAMFGKFVSEAFKEVHNKEWKASHPTKTDIVQKIIETLKTPARWNKAMQHLREAGRLTDDPRDIGLLFKEVPADLLKEETEWIKQQLFDWAWPHIARGVTVGIPEFYKAKLLEQQFTKEAA